MNYKYIKPSNLEELEKELSELTNGVDGINAIETRVKDVLANSDCDVTTIKGLYHLNTVAYVSKELYERDERIVKLVNTINYVKTLKKEANEAE